MPQLDILSYGSELLWFFLFFGSLYIFILKVFVPFLLRRYFSYRNVLKKLSCSLVITIFGYSISSVDDMLNFINSIHLVSSDLHNEFNEDKACVNEIQEFFSTNEIIHE
jgi:Plant ATP synthase F0